MGGLRVNLAVMRTAATVLVTALAALTQAYPHNPWFVAATSAAATFGIHAVPAVGQKGPAVTEFPAPKMSPEPQAPELENPLGLQGATLMGVTMAAAPDNGAAAAETAPAEAPAKAPVPVAAPVLSEDTIARYIQGPAKAPVPVAAPVLSEDTIARYIQGHVDLLREMANGLNRLLNG